MITFVVQPLSCRLPGVVFAGAAGGFVGGGHIGLLLGWRGGREVAELLGGYAVVPLAGGVLGAVGGAWGAVCAWRLRTRGRRG